MNLDPTKAIFAVFLAGVVAAVGLFFYNTQIAPTLRSTLTPKAAA